MTEIEQGLRRDRTRTLNVVVAGMHRTGTSAVAGALQAAGLYVGADHELMPEHAQNPAGFIERLDVVALNDAMLASIDQAWDAPDPQPASFATVDSKLLEQGRALIESVLDGHRPWLIKDPRISLLLPAWRQILLDRCVVIIPLRDPGEVAWSLRARDGFTVELGLALWAAYHRHLAAGLEGLPVVTVDYAALSSDPEPTVRALLDALAHLGVAGTFDGTKAAQAIDPLLRRATEPDGIQADDEVGRALRDLGARWDGQPVRVYERFRMPVDPPSRWEVALLAGHRQLVRLREIEKSAREEVEQTRRQVAVSQQAIDELTDNAATAQAEVDSFRSRGDVLAQELERSSQRIESVVGERESLRIEVHRLREALAEVEGQALQLKRDINAVKDYSDRLALEATSELSESLRLAAADRAGLWRRIIRAIAPLVPASVLGVVWHNPLFDAAWYRARYPDVRRSRLGAELHFRRHGAAERRNPNAFFDTDWYLRVHKDVAQSRLNPLDHFLFFGLTEHRSFRPPRYAPFGVAEIVSTGGHAFPAAGGHPVAAQADEPHALQREGANAWARPGAAAAVAAPGHDVSRFSVGVVIHLYHTDLWPEIRSHLANLDRPRLFVSLARETGDGFDAHVLRDYPDAVIRYFENRGRDMGPFIEFLHEGALEDIDLVCKLHTKRSVHRIDGNEWRRRLLGALMGSRSVVREIAETFASDPKLGILGPADAFTDSDEYWGSNRDTVLALGRRMGRSDDESKLSFFAGSMFWFRPKAVEALRRLGLRQSDFEEEEGQLDGALQHALERLFPVAALASGYHLASFEPRGRRARGGTVADGRIVKLIAFYLPQFHVIPENDSWWEPGFTEWTQVVRSRPLFQGHNQPRLPALLGFYDLRVPEARQAQADLALSSGISGFCYYYYWFDGRQILERPLNDVLRSGEPDFPFCICWANENWTRRWDGLDSDVLLSQHYSMESNRNFINDVIPILRDPRYITFDGKPILMVYRPLDIPDIEQTVSMWRSECRNAGLGEIHLVAGRFGDVSDVRALGFDAAVDFPPHQVAVRDVSDQLPGLVSDFTGLAYDYEHVVEENLRTMGQGYAVPAHRGIMLAWDNTPRRGPAAHFAHGASPALYERWLTGIIEQEMEHSALPESLIFINAWNEWGEGANLEPDTVFGNGFLDATRAALAKAERPDRRAASRGGRDSCGRRGSV